MAKYMIIGNGVAGIEAALAIRSKDDSGSIAIITKSEFLHYNRTMLIPFLGAQNIEDVKDLIVYDEKFYQSKKIENILHTKIERIDASHKTITDTQGKTYPYEKLLIATGSSPVVPPLPGMDLKGVFTLRGINDVRRFRSYSADIKKILVIGGGLLGLENAWSIQSLGKDVLVAEGAPWLLPRQLDEAGGRFLQRQLEAKGLNIVLGDFVERLEGNNRGVHTVRFKSGRMEEIGAVLVSIGIRPDLSLFQNLETELNRGILVDDHLQSNLPDIWAAGDVAEHNGVIYGLWSVAREQGKIAGLNMAGVETAYKGSVTSILLKITGINVLSVGDIQNPGTRILENIDPQAYRKLTIDDDDKPRSAMIVGDRSAIARTQKIMQGKLDPEIFLEPIPPTS